jgi:hypothetical protein
MIGLLQLHDHNMKIGVIKLGARIMWETDAAVGPGEAISICKALQQGGANVHVITKILTKDTLHPSLTWHNILAVTQTELDALDVLVVVNGNVNFFGGAEDEAQITNYKVINNFKGAVVYVMCDPELPLMQIWDNVSGKEWGSKYHEADIKITRTDIKVLSQPFAVDKVKERWQKKKGAAPIGGVFHFPMERFPLLNAWLPAMTHPTVDLMYGGTTRGGRRIPNLYKWYVDLPVDLAVEIFGKIDADDFIKHPKVGAVIEAAGLTNGYAPHYPTFTGMVKYCDVLPKMNNALAHLVTGDPSYEVLDIIPQRAMECIAAGNVVFVDANMDSSRRIYPSGLANSFLYVSTRQEFIGKLLQLKADPSLRLQLLQSQMENTAWDADKFCRSLVDVLKAA